MENQRYMQEGLDVKRVLLLLKKKLWMVMAAAAIGALGSGGVYLLVHLVFASAREFQSVSKIYLNFNCEPKDFSELSYNGYTWNDLMATDPILEYTMEALPDGMDRAVVIGATKAEILSDIRLLTITVTANEPKLAAQIMEATQKSLVHLGETDELFESIEIYSTEGPQQIVWDNRTVQAAVTGAVVGAFAVLMALAFYYVLEDSVYVAADVEKRYRIPVFGVFVAGREGKGQPYGLEFAVNYGYVCRDAESALLVGLDAGEDVETAGRMIGETVKLAGEMRRESADKAGSMAVEAVKTGRETVGEELKENLIREEGKREKAGRTPGGIRPGAGAEGAAGIRFPRLLVGGSLEEDADIYRRIRESDGAVLAVRYGGRNGKRLERALGILKKQDCRVLGAVIVDADERFLKWYYMGRHNESLH